MYFEIIELKDFAQFRIRNDLKSLHKIGVYDQEQFESNNDVDCIKNKNLQVPYA